MTPEEILVAILKNREASAQAGAAPARVYLSRDQYRSIRRWHASLGELPKPELDYIGEYSILGLEVFEDPSGSLRVE